MSRITYSLPYLQPSKTELQKVNTLIRKAYKSVLQLSLSTSTARFESLGVHNTAEELIEAHTSNQIARLSKTPTGNHILKQLKINQINNTEDRFPQPPKIHKNLTVKPIPRNMHPVYHAKRREQRPKALQQRFPTKVETIYVDAAEYRHRAAFAIAVTNDPQKPLLTSLTLLTSNPATAEEAAIRPEREQSRPLAAAGRTAPSVDGALASSAFSRCVRRKTHAAHDKTTNMCARLAVSNDIVTSACAFPLETQ